MASLRTARGRGALSTDARIVLLLWLGSAIAASVVWWRKGGSYIAALGMGLVFGPLALLLTYFTAPTAPAHGPRTVPRRACPRCREPIAIDADICIHCHRESDGLEVNTARPPNEVRAKVLHLELQRHGPQTLDELARSTGTPLPLARNAVTVLLRIGAARKDGERFEAS